jgi:hypothetical protein
MDAPLSVGGRGHCVHSFRRRVRSAPGRPVENKFVPKTVAGIVSTCKGVEKTIESWIRWHGELGFQMFLYFDSPASDRTSIEIASRFACVTVVKTDDAFRQRERYDSLPSWPALTRDVSSQVQARQRLNCEHCARSLAPGRGVEWLLHIDSDELFSPPACGIKEHFASLEKAGCWQYSYGNVEAVPGELDSSDPFRSIENFRQHDDWLPPETRQRGQPANAAYLFWLARSNRLLNEPLYFLFYANGKSAVKVSTSGLLCGGVHGWNGKAARSGWRTNIPSLAQREGLVLCPSTSRPRDRPTILHYACCSLTAFARKNWPALGYLDPSGRFGRGTSKEEAPHIHRWHDKQGGTAGTGKGGVSTEKALRDDYCSLVALLDAAEMSRQLKAGVLVRIEGPSKRLINRR